MPEKHTISEFMTRTVVTIEGSETVRKAKRLMSAHSIRHLPVVGHGQLHGIMSDRDIKLAQAVSRRDDFDDVVQIREVCQTQVYMVEGTTPASTVLSHMYKMRIGSALITDGKKLIGIFTVTDACRAFAEFLRSMEGDNGGVAPAAGEEEKKNEPR